MSSGNVSRNDGVLNPMNLDRPQPHNEEAERAVLCSMMLDPTAAAQAFTTLVMGGAFYRPAHQTVFQAMRELNSGKGDAGLDLIVLRDHLEKTGRLEGVGGISSLLDLTTVVPSAANVTYYLDIVKQNAILRHIISSCSEAIVRCFNADDDIKGLLDSIEQRIFEVTQLNEAKDIQEIGPLLREAVAYLEKLNRGDTDTIGLKTGFWQLDRAITGLRPGELFVLAARPSIGKTALALNMAANIAMGPAKIPVGFFSLEMPAQQLVLRLICSEARTSMGRFTAGGLGTGEWRNLMDACGRLKDSKIVVDDTGAIDILELRSKARRMKSRQDIGVLFVDYLQLIHTDAGRNASRENEVAKISGALKALAKELSIPIVVLAQLNRQAEQGEKPKLSNLRESGAIEQDADVVALLHRDREKQYAQKIGSEEGIDSELIIAKNRNGSTGLQELTFFPGYTRFENKTQVSDADVPMGV